MTTGMVLGKFMPPHRGHQYLIDFARHWVDELYVVVGTLRDEPIPGQLRFRWMQNFFAGYNVNVLHLTDENPQEPGDHPDFWSIWRTSLQRILPTAPDVVFASEPYGHRLADELGARFVPVDPSRELVPVSATDIRRDPMATWSYLLPPARPWFVRRICMFGPESTGKSTLARDLARRYDTVYVAEYARTLLATQGDEFCENDFPAIARGHLASEDAMALQANRLLFVDTDLLITTIWADTFYGRCPDWIRRLADERTYDLYLVTDVDVPWVPGPQRFLPENREAFRDRCIAELERRGRPYVLLQGDWANRLTVACAAVDAVLEAPSCRRRPKPTLPPRTII